MHITSTKNAIVRRFAAAATAATPDAAGLMVADGVTLVAEALSAGRQLVEVAVSPRLESSERGRALLAHLRERGVPLTECSDAVVGRLSSLDTHQGIVATVARPAWRLADLLAGAAPLVVVAAGIKDPGNLGALVRTAEAAGASGVLALAGGADPFRAKAVRSSAGSAFRLPVLVAAAPAATQLGDAGLQLLVAEAAAPLDYLDADLRGPTALVLGHETGGVPAVLAGAADARIRIPMAAPSESLNVAVAAGVLLFEARRQRRTGR